MVLRVCSASCVTDSPLVDQVTIIRAQRELAVDDDTHHGLIDLADVSCRISSKEIFSYRLCVELLHAHVPV